MEDELEEHVLTIGDTRVADFVDLRNLDLEQVPYAIRSDVRFDIEWTYTLDLDHEIFSVWDSAHFRMDNIPRKVWIRALRDAGGQLTVATNKCPPASTACPALISQRHDSDHLAKHRQKYQELKCSIVGLNPCLDPDTQKDFQSRCFRGLVYMAFCDAFDANFKNYSLTWVPDDFVFREMAFAILSLASGQVRLEDFPSGSGELDIYWDPSHLKKLAYLTVDEGRGVGGSTILPRFATGAHRPGELPGSAPPGTIYWFEDVLVCLATGLDKRESCQAAIAKAVESGLEQGATDFQAVVVDLLFCVLLDVHMESGEPVVRHSRPISLFPIQPTDHASMDHALRPAKRDLHRFGADYQNDDDGDHGDEQQNSAQAEVGIAAQGETRDDTASGDGETDNFSPILSQQSENPLEYPSHFSAHCPGFVALMDFFNVATARRFRRQPTTPGVFPAEIYANILEYADAHTHRACSGINWAFRAYTMRHFRIDDTYVLDKVGYYREENPFLQVVNTATGIEEDLPICRRPEERPFLSRSSPKRVWVPVVGSQLPSILSQVKVTYSPASDVGGMGDSEGDIEDDDEET